MRDTWFVRDRKRLLFRYVLKCRTARTKASSSRRVTQYAPLTENAAVVAHSTAQMLMIAGISIQDKGLTNGSRAKAVAQASSQTYGQSASVRWWRGLATVAKLRTNRRKNPARPRKQENCSSLELVGVGQSGADAALARLVATPCSFSMCPRNNVSLVSRDHLEGFSHKPAQWIAGRSSSRFVHAPKSGP